jgi:hypothetical protein
MDYGQIDTTYGKFLGTRPAEEDGPIYMVNFMKYRQVARYDGDGEAISGREADDRYSPTDVLARIGADVAFFGNVKRELPEAGHRLGPHGHRALSNPTLLHRNAAAQRL